MALLISLLALASTIAAVPSVNLPINAQVPPVARVSKAFDFVFSESTFASSAPSITYILSNSTRWLSLDSPSRTLSGIPGPGDVGSVTVNLVATDDAGSTSMLVTLVVSADPGPGRGAPLGNQLSTHGPSSGADSLVLSHSTSISLSFLPETFTNTNDKTVYYAICANNTPLPSWLTFNPIGLSFSGTTPESTSSAELSQTFGIKLIASDVVGFSGAVVTFELILESHLFTFGKSWHTFSVMPGKSFNYTGLQADLLFDGVPIKPSDLAQATAQTTSWVAFDAETLALCGTAPVSASPQNITVSATDAYGDSADTVIFIQIGGNTSGLFNDAIDTLNASIGSAFDYDLSGILNTSPGLLVTVDLGNASSWLEFDPSKLELTGSIPNDIKPQQVSLKVTAHQGSQTQSKTITLDIVGAGGSGNGRTAGRSTTIATPTATSQPRSPIGVPASSETIKHRKEAVLITVPLVLFLLGALILALHLRRRRQQQFKRGYLNSSKEKISYPFQATEHREVALDEAGIPSTPRFQRASLLPRIDWRRSRLRSSRASGNEAQEPPKSESWQEEVVRAIPELGLSHELPQSQARARKHSSSMSRSKNSRISSKNHNTPARRLSKPMTRRSHISRASSLLLSAHRISGVGHGHASFNEGNSSISYSNIGAGHGIGGPSGYGRVRQSVRNASILSGSSWATTSTSAFNNNRTSSHHLRSEPSRTASTLGSFTNPPTMNSLDLLGRANTIHEAEDDDRPWRSSGRAIAYPPPVHSRALSPRGAFLKRRARERQIHNPLFSAGPSSRVSSHLRRQSTLRRQYSQSQQSFSGSPSKPSLSQRSPRRFNNYSFSTRVIDSFGRLSRFQSRSSFGSSNRYQSAESETPSEGFYDGSEGLREELDEEGNKSWRHIDYPNPLATHRSDRGSSPHTRADLGNDEGAFLGETEHGPEQLLDVETLLSGGERGSRAMRLSYLRAQAEGNRATSGWQERRLVVGSKQKRPASVDAHIGLKRGEGNTSMRGDVRDVAFL